jgi:hypothetical protein
LEVKSTSHKGAAGETFCASWFLQQGLEVFLNIPAVGPADMVLWDTDTGKLLPVDVKTSQSPYVRKDGTVVFSAKVYFREDGVAQILWVMSEAAPRLPEGFWEALGRSSE